MLSYGMPPTLHDHKVFRCMCYVTPITQNKTKLDPRAKKCEFLDFQKGTTSHIILNLQTHVISISRNVIIYENNFPYKLRQHFCVDSDSSVFCHEFSQTFFSNPTLMEHSVPTIIQPNISASKTSPFPFIL